ncbi:hypothetical protein PanWU01x14_344910, partial [Parasponia andersonii]
KTTNARGVKNRGQTSRRWPEKLTGCRIFVGPLQLRLTSKRVRNSGTGFVFDRPLTQAGTSLELDDSGGAAEFHQKLTLG